MNTTINHLIEKHGILSTFTIAKKITKDEIKKITSFVKKKCKNKKQYNEMLKAEILNNITESLKHNKIPGVILQTIQDNSFFKNDQEKVTKLNLFANVISTKISTNKLSKDEICYLILYMFNLLGITQEDFINFHRKNGTLENSEEDPDNDDDDSD